MTSYTDTEARWAERQLPRAERASVTLSAWTSDEEIAAAAADHTRVYGNRYETDTILRLARSELRAAAMAANAKSSNRK
ncbi:MULTISPECIES: hypothetical protein [Mycobacteroides]|uniref:hypothetical protein n=1 Tax=Mycobacteroides TaxID=670516 RepID=UPI0008A9A351|nr:MULTISPECIES: hypothetical protein [Mycobacteroides]AYM40326.1 hypothetical protein DYE20_01080 [[Mycobacterium] chelonae subsp. gwanakae]OHU15910.1 hypothetical protein BKG75_12745 [Mycobacteroides chelonae]SIF26062.1 Uncharacterised protein [Mycobacteroides abscessus subsp. abscessus]SIF39130.1 Uncharacterised protein [Mycobacteroides abscessus subsp. abscessus]SIF83091.1 Uncharacterised protein [Mycobacteroides abscessus subsp. abscessus]